MRFQIFMWHGYCEKLAKLLEPFCNLEQNAIYVSTLNPEGKVFYYEGSLDNFAEKFPRHFWVNKERGWIAVTEYTNFGQR